MFHSSPKRLHPYHLVSIMEPPIGKRRFLCVEYPGIVENRDKMIDTLGGVRRVTETYVDKTKRLELKLRPDDEYCKAVNGDRNKTHGLLLKIKRKKLSQQQPSSSQSDNAQPSIIEAEVLGTIDTKYCFQSLMDFQYLPVKRNENGQYESIVKDIIPTKIYDREWLTGDGPLFLPPPIFSRIDSITDYAYKDAPKTLKETVRFTARQRRPHHTIICTFHDPTPTEASEEAMANMTRKPKNYEHYEELKKLFEERPIWSKNGLCYHLNMDKEQCKVMLPCVGYYFNTGPWRTLWVRIGYDPRKDPSSKKYQLVDFRIRKKGTAEMLGIKIKRSTKVHRHPTSSYKPGTTQPSTISKGLLRTVGKIYPGCASSKPVNSVQPLEAMFRFSRTLIPVYHQTFYQICDIDVEEIQKLIHENDGQEIECTEQNGWCIKDIQERCREIMTRIVDEVAGVQLVSENLSEDYQTIVRKGVVPVDPAHELPEKKSMINKSKKTLPSKTQDSKQPQRPQSNNDDLVDDDNIDDDNDDEIFDDDDHADEGLVEDEEDEEDDEIDLSSLAKDISEYLPSS